MLKRQQIIFVHLLNDTSGSPKVLKEIIEILNSNDFLLKLYLGSCGDGILSNTDIGITRYWYYRSPHRILTLFYYLFSQAILLCKLLIDVNIDKNAVIYVNTLLPFGAAIYGRLTGRKVIYHIHELSINPTPLKYLLTTIARITSNFNIYVSDAHMSGLPIATVPARRVYNTLDANLIARANQSTYTCQYRNKFNILMIAYLRDYKGVPEFMALADVLKDQTQICFDLVVSDDEEAINHYFSGRSLPSNMIVHPRTDDTGSFYSRASLVLNLSRVDLCVETFGLTILEAMAFGIPVIVPPVGGPSELVEDGVQGFQIDSRDISLLKEKVLVLANNEELCQQLSAECRQQAKGFSSDCFAEKIREVIADVRNE